MSRHDRANSTASMLEHAREMAREFEAAAVMVCADVFASSAETEAHFQGDHGGKTILVARDPTSFREGLPKWFDVLQVPDVSLTRIGQIKMAILLALSRGMVRRGDKVICLSGIAGAGKLDTVLFTTVGEEPEMLATTDEEHLRQQSHPEVFERVLDIALELGQEGRQGQAVGAIFVIGDIERVEEFSEPLMLNPFRGHPPEERNILSPSLRQTIKELTALDGAFLIRGDGVVEAAGVYLRPATGGSVLPQRLGARHRSAAAITAGTGATAITVSESTGDVTVFCKGKIIIEIEKSLRPVPKAPRRGDVSQGGSPGRVDELVPEGEPDKGGNVSARKDAGREGLE